MGSPPPESTLFFSRFLQLLAKDDYLLAQAFNRVVVGHADKDTEAINSMVAVLLHHGKVYPLVRLLVKEDLTSACGSTFLRENARSTNLVQGLLRCYESDLLDGELGDFVLDVVRKVIKGKVDDRPASLMDLARKALSLIYECDLPGPIRHVCSVIAEACRQAKHEVNSLDPASFTVGSVVFLHMLCPALVAPSKFSAVKRYMRSKDKTVLPPEVTKVLVTLVKLIQALANGTNNFTNPSMTPYNTFLASEKDRYTDYCKEVVDCPLVESVLLPESKLMRRWKVIFRFAKRRGNEVVGKSHCEVSDTIAQYLRDAIASVDASRSAATSPVTIRTGRSNSMLPQSLASSDSLVCSPRVARLGRRGSSASEAETTSSSLPSSPRLKKRIRTSTFLGGIGSKSPGSPKKPKKRSLGGLYG